MTEFLLHPPGWLLAWGSWMISASWQLLAFSLLAGLLSGAFARMPARLRHAIWVLVLAKALLPPWIAAEGTVGDWGVAPAEKVLSENVTAFANLRALVLSEADSSALGVPYRAYHVSLQPLAAGWTIFLLGMLVVWGLGALAKVADALLLQWDVAAVRREARAVDSGPLRRMLEECAAELGVRRMPELVLSGQASTPFLCGWRRPCIVLPAGLPGELSPRQLRAVLLHELVHLQRGDVMVCWLQTVAGILFWFHPSVSLAIRAVSVERELCVDEALAESGRVEIAEYARAILRVATLVGRGADALLAFLGVARRECEVRLRIERLLVYQPPSRLVLIAGWTIVAVFAAEFLPMAMPTRGPT